MPTPPPAEAPAGGPHRTVSPVDKLRFLAWASTTHRLKRSEQAVLLFVVENILGLQGGKPFNGWVKAALLAERCGLTRRGVQLALRGLHERELLRSWGIAGRGGCIRLHAPLLVGAAATLPRVRLARAAADAPAVGNANGASPSPVENANKRAAKTRTPVRMSPASDPSQRFNPAEGARGGTAAGAAGAAVGSNVEDDEEGQLTLPRARLLARLQGLASKAGHAVGVAFLDHLGPDAVQRLLRHQRERRDGKLVGEAVQLLAAYLAVNPEELGAAVAAEPKGQKPPEGPPPIPQPPARPEERPPAPPPAGPPPLAAAEVLARPWRGRAPSLPGKAAFGCGPQRSAVFASERAAMNDRAALLASAARLNALSPIQHPRHA